MKAESNITKVKKAGPPTPTIPNVPFHRVDVEGILTITQSEITRYANALYYYRIARADFKRKHGELLYKLEQGSRPDPKDNSQVHLDKDGRIVLTDSSSSGPPDVDRAQF